MFMTDPETTLVISNGIRRSEKRQNLDRLFELLESEPLCPVFEQYHCYKVAPYETEVLIGKRKSKWEGEDHFFGNFATVSFVFDIVTKDKELSKKISDAIDKNVATEQYQRLAFKVYAGWHYANTPSGKILLPPRIVDDIKLKRDIPIGKYRPTTMETIKTAELLGPRFADSQIVSLHNLY